MGGKEIGSEKLKVERRNPPLFPVLNQQKREKRADTLFFNLCLQSELIMGSTAGIFNEINTSKIIDTA